MSNPTCEKHGVEMEYLDCLRCGGDGYTDDDIYDYENPAVWSDGKCHVCNGTGTSPYPSCEECDQELYDREDWEP